MRVSKQSNSLRLAIFVPFIVLVFFFPRMSDPFNLPKLLLLALLTLVVTMMFVIEFRFLEILRNLWGLRRIYTFFLVGFLVVVSLALFSDSHEITRALLGGVNRNNGILYYWAVGLISLVIVAQTRDRISNRQLERNFVIVGLLIAIYGFIQFFNRDFVELQNPYNRIVITLGNPNFSSTATAILGIAVLVLAFDKLKYSSNLALGITLLALSASLAFLSWATESLQGILIYALGCWLFLIRILTLQKQKVLKIALLLFTLCGITMVMVSFIGFGPLGTALEQYTLKLRFIYASYGLKAMVNRPLTGLGADEYLQAFLKYRSSDFINTYGLGTVTDNAHSVPINIGANFGVIAMVMFIALQLMILFKSLHNLFFTSGSSSTSILLSLTSILLIFQATLSIEQIGLGCAMWAFGALVIQEEKVDGNSRDVDSWDKPRRLNALASNVREIATIVAAFVFVATLQFDREDKAWKNIVYLQYSGSSDSSFVLGEYRKLTPLTLSEPRKVAPILDNLLKTGDQETSFNLVESNLTSNPRSAVSVELMANVREYQGFTLEKLDLLKRLVSLDPSNYETLFKYGEALRAAGNETLAKEIFNQVIQLGPSSNQARLSEEELQKMADDR